MSTHLSETEIERYRQRSLTPAERLAAADHLAACETCRQQLARVGEPEDRLADAFRAVQAQVGPGADAASEHLSDEQLMGYVDNGLDEIEREIAEGHLESCARCAAEVEELRGFKALLTTYPAKEHAPLPPPSAWERLRAALGRPAVWIPLQAGRMAVVAAAVWIVLAANHRAWHTQIARSEAEARAAQAQADRLRQQVAAAQGLQSEVARLQQEQARLRRVAEQLRRAPKNPQPGSIKPPPLEGGLGSKLSPPLAETKLALNDGGATVTQDAQGDLVRVERLPAVAEAALKAQRFVTPALLAALGSLGSGTTRGSGDHPEFAVLSPAGKVVLETRPTFSWRPLAAATSYRVAVYDSDGARVTGTPDAGVPETRWTPAQALRRGRIYEWQVTAMKGDEELGIAPVPPAKFQVVAAATVEQLDRYASSPFTRGVLAAQAGLLVQAEAAFRQVLQANPHSATARKLLDQVRALHKKV